MKNLTLLLFALGISTSLFSQKIVVKNETEKFSTGKQDAISTTVYEASLDDVEDAWKSTLKKFKNESVKTSKGEVFADNVLIPDWGNNTVDVYTIFKENKKTKEVTMFVAFDLGGAYLSSSSDNDKYRKAEKMIKEFAINTTKEAYNKQKKDLDKGYTKLEDQQKKLLKEQKSLEEDITDYRAKNVKLEKEVITNDADIVKKKKELDAQKKVVSASSGAVSEQAKSSQKIYDKIESQLKDLEKEKDNNVKSIENNKKKIEKAEKELVENQDNQSKTKVELEAQKKLIDTTIEKINKVD